MLMTCQYCSSKVAPSCQVRDPDREPRGRSRHSWTTQPVRVAVSRALALLVMPGTVETRVPAKQAPSLGPLPPALRRYLYFTATVTGAVVLVVEILGREDAHALVWFVALRLDGADHDHPAGPRGRLLPGWLDGGSRSAARRWLRRPGRRRGLPRPDGPDPLPPGRSVPGFISPSDRSSRRSRCSSSR